MKHFLSIEHSNGDELTALVMRSAELKAERGTHASQPLAGQSWGLIFTKSSTRTRVSFEVGINELGGTPMFLSARDLQLGRGEPIKDTARVLGRMVHGAVIRTFDQKDVEDFAEYSAIPTINALTDEEHPCQIIADLLTMHEKLGGWDGKKACFLGDADCNVAKSWMWAAKHLGFELVLSAPSEFQPSSEYLAELGAPNVRCEDDPQVAIEGAHTVYTDVWVSMGKEEESAGRIESMQPYQVNHELLSKAAADAIVMHCLPAYRGKEITEDVLEENAGTIFQEAENRLHAQKAILEAVVDPGDQ